jgi:hypothetical protein
VRFTVCPIIAFFAENLTEKLLHICCHKSLVIETGDVLELAVSYKERISKA